MRAGPPLLLLLLALSALPPAGADHVSSHRVYVVGRVVDEAGLPAPGVPVNATFHGVSVVGSCYDSKPEVTGPRGDFEVCRHAHALGAGASVTLEVGGVSRNVSVDPDLRHAVAHVQLDEARAVRDVEGDIEFARHLRVAGRSYYLLTRPQTEEGVEVNATPMGGSVSVELRSGEEVLARVNATVGEHGRYSVDLPIEQIPAAAVVRVRVGSDVSEAPAANVWRRVDVNVVRDLTLLQPGGDQPGSARTPLAGWPALVALALAGLTCGAASRRRSRG